MKKQLYILMLAFLTLWMGGSPAFAAKDFNIKNNTQSFFYLNGTSGNVGIGSVTPGQLLDVNGTARMTGFTLSNNGAAAGNVMITNGVGVGTWMPVSTLNVSGTNYWLNTAAAGNVGISTTNTVGIGTTFAGAGAGLLVMNGNVGIGTWVPFFALDIQSANANGAIGLPFADGSGAGPDTGWIIGGQLQGNNIWSIIGMSSSHNTMINIPNTAGGGVKFVRGGNETNTLATILVTGQVGIGTITPVNILSINGGVGIGTANSSYVNTTIAPSGGMIVQGNVGVGSLSPGTALDVNGTIRSTAIGTSDFVSNVGIGSLTPGTALDVQGITRTTGFILNNSPVSGDILMTNGLGLGTWIPVSAVTTVAGPGGSSPQLQYNNAGVLGGVSNSSVSATGNVGLGSAAPGQVLDVQGTVRTTGFILSNNGAAAGNVMVTNGIGIGTWMPVGTLNVSGTNYWLNTAAAGNVGISTTNTVGIGTTFAGAGAGLLVMNGNVGIGTWAPVNTLSLLGNAAIGSSSGFLDTANKAPSNGLLIQGNVGIGTFNNVNGSLVDMAGDVGIGSTAPGVALDVFGAHIYASNSTIMRLNFNGTGASDGIQLTSGGFDYGYIGFFNPTGDIYQPTDTGLYIASAAAHSVPIVFTIGVNEIMRLGNDAGNSTNVGIGTSNPFSKLDIVGGESIASTQSSAYAINTAAAGNMIVQGNVGIGTFNPFGGNLIVKGSGNVGIGSLVPGQILDVQGTVRTTGFSMSGQTPISGYVMTASDSAGDTTWTSAGVAGGWTVSGNNVYETSSGNVGIGTFALQTALAVTNGNVGIGTWTAAGGNLIVKGGGNVGIGSAWPGQMLDVQGTVRTIGGIINGNVGIGTSALQAALAITNGNVGIGTWTAGGGALIVSSGVGNVGIGSAWPGQVLDVNGTARMTGFTLTGNGAATGEILITNGVGVGTWMAASTLPISGTIAGLTVNFLTKAATASSLTNSSIFDNGTNVGIGSGAPSAGLDVGGTIAAAGAGNSYFSIGNLGVGTTNPGQMLDVQGTVRTTGFSMSGQTPISGYVMTASDSAGDTTWTSAGVAGGWTATGNNLYETSNGNVGIGTNLLTTAALTVMDGNVGIGTWKPAGSLVVIGGNVGIGSSTPGQLLDVKGTVRTTFFTMSGQTPISGYVMTASDSAGDTTWTPAGTVEGWTVTGNNVYETNSGNVGIGTNTPQGSLVVTNGSVGIGTWAPLAGVALDVNGIIRIQGTNSLILGNDNKAGFEASAAATGDIQIVTNSLERMRVTSGGNVGIGTTTPQGGFVVTNGNVGIGTWAPAYNLDLVNGTARMRNIRRVNTIASSATPAINTDITDVFSITALATPITSMTSSLSGTPTNCDLLEIRILDNGTPQGITWGASFASTTVLLPTTTQASTLVRILLEWNSATSKWECIGVA